VTIDQVKSRRQFLTAAAAAVAGGVAATIGGAETLRAQGEPLAGQGANGSLRDPTVVGRSRSPTSAQDNDEAIKRIEKRLHCTCGCNLDVFTCRTTDFSCTYSPELHREVVALYNQGKTAQQILDAFVAKYGEKVLMAPPPGGFNLLGYLMPGVAITIGAVVLAVVIGRRERQRSRVLAAAGGAAGAVGAVGASGSAGASGAAPTTGEATASADATPEELERLRRALAEVDD
jgi:cytochrome c-type biogenesis protein CcmH